MKSRTIRALDYHRRHGNTAEVVRIEAELRHQKRCRCCGRVLTDPDSISKGIGPDCESKLRAAS